MKTLRAMTGLKRIRAPLVLAIGFYDGVHLGHQAVLRLALKRARARGGEAWAMTFDPHPLQVVRPDRAPPLLMTLEERIRCMSRTGVDGCLVLPFTRRLAQMEPETFIDRLQRSAPSLIGIVVGARWTFGRGARGNAALLRRLAAPLDWEVIRARPVTVDGRPVSSTRLRSAVSDGRMEDAARLAGRPYSLSGEVRHGREMGTELGFPTANVRVPDVLLPPPGVYAARTRVGADAWPSAAYIGTRPSVEANGDVLLETHLLDFHGDLYGKTLDVELLHRVRADARFPSLEALQTAMRDDIAAARRYAAGLSAHG